MHQVTYNVRKLRSYLTNKLLPCFLSFVLLILSSYVVIKFCKPIHIFLDEKIYIEAGRKYINGMAPYFFNFEHPPLAKYLIGVFDVLHAGNFLPVMCIVSSIFLVSLLFNYLVDFKYASVYAVALIISDALVINSLFFQLLDPVAILFTSGYLYAIVKCMCFNKQGCGYHWICIAGTLAGLALASKWSSLYVLAPTLLVFLAYRKNIKEISLIFIVIAIAYATSFLADLMYGGPNLFLEHHIRMIKYMSYQHRPTLSMFLNGLPTLLCKTSLWHHRGVEYLTIWINDTSVNYNLTYINVNTLLIEFEPWLGSFNWVIALYYLPRLVRDSLKNKGPWLIITSAMLGSLALPLLHGNLGWYYLFFAILAPAILCKYLSRKAIILLIAVNIIQVVLLQFGIINSKYSFELALSAI